MLIQDIPLPGEINHSIRNEESVERAFEYGAAAVGIMYGVLRQLLHLGGRGRRTRL